MLEIESQILKKVNEIKNNLKNGGHFQEEKKKFYKVVSEIKVNGIKSDEILNLIQEIRTTLVNDWRSKQHSIISGIILWIGLISLGSCIIYFRDIPIIPSNIIWSVILSTFFLFLGWFFINLGVHNLGHYIAGRFVGIKYKAWVTFNFFGQWALIIDYKSYLKATFNQRQVVHISGPFCTLITPWIIYFATWHPFMIGIAIYMIVASIPLILKKGWDYGRIFRERQLKKKYRKIHPPT